MTEKRRLLMSALVFLLAAASLTAGGKAEAPAAAGEKPAAARAPSHYYLVGAVLAHPYIIDQKLGMRHVAKYLGCTVDIVGPQDWDMTAQAEALEQVIPKKPDGIIIPLWDATALPGVKRAMSMGIPVVAIEAAVADHGCLTYIGLDNYQAGYDTGLELIKRGGKSGKLGIVMNAGASNTELKKAGVLDAIKDTGWQVVVQAEDKANTEDAIEAAKAMFNAHPEITGVVGLDSSAGTGIGVAIEELKLQAKDMTIVVHDREDTVLEYVAKGVIDATVVAKTALMSYLAVALLEDYNARKSGKMDVPICGDNLAA
ncbi:MAG: substrate-binding domain-containing protein, partial [Sedimentisphaerales bacterium]|nr:substrate-binding domain-containing protein [Sedimentisphaerales bacterium]